MKDNFIELLKNKYNIAVNDQQEKCVLHTKNPALILAVPGAGKTTVLLCRLFNLIANHGVDPARILSVTFSKASARDMQNRFNTLFGEDTVRGLSFSTIHSLAYQIVKQYASIKKVRLTLIEGNNGDGRNEKQSKVDILKKLYLQINKEYINDDDMEKLSNLIGFFKNKMIKSEDFESYEISIENFKEIYIQYEEIKKKNNYIDFDDMLEYAYKILKNIPSLLEHYQNRWDYIQVDEGQDTSLVQHEIINLLVKKSNNIFIVADDDQSIYKFRGAEPDYLLNFQKRYADAKIYFMEENYRSVKTVVDVSGEFIKANKKRYKKQLKTSNKTHIPITVVEPQNVESQALEIISRAKQRGKKEMAVLFRNNSSAIPIVDVLDVENIPFYISDIKADFFRHWIVEDIRCFMNVALNDRDLDSFNTIYYKMNAYLSKTTMDMVKNIENDNLSVFEKLLKAMENMQRYQIDKIRNLMFDFRYIKEKEPKYVIDYIEMNLNYDKYLRDMCDEKKYNYDNLKSILYNLKIIASRCKTIPDFLTRMNKLSNLIKESKFKNNGNPVILSTVHSAKGLEYDEVCLIDLTEGDFPVIKKSKDKNQNKGKNKTKQQQEVLSEEEEALEEERRLFYVGMTRTRGKLELFVPKNKGSATTIKSQFVVSVEEIIKGDTPKPTAKPNKEIKPAKDKLDFNVKEFKVGDKVSHDMFGRGTIMNKSNGMLVIRFENFGDKKLLEEFCLKGKMLALIK